MPAIVPDTTPVEEIVAINVLLLLHTPPEELLLKSVVSPVHTVVEPNIADGKFVTVTVYVLTQLPSE